MSKIIRLSPENANLYIGSKIVYTSRSKLVTGIILGVSPSGKSIKIDNPDLKDSLEIVNRKVYVIPENSESSESSESE